jgi:hypothetical protein
MTEKRKRSAWITGCGIGCGVLLLIGILGVVGLTVFVGKSMRGFDEALATREQLDERFGPGDAFTPNADGAIPAERIEAFLRARERVAPLREELAEFFEMIENADEQARELEQASFWEKLSFTGSITRQAMVLPGSMGRFFGARNQALLDESMGFGEYTYIYVLTYYSWLGHSPAHGPDSVAVGVALDDDEAEVPEVAELPTGRLPRRAHENLVGMLRNQLAALDGAAADALPEGFVDALAAEIEAMERDRDRLPWQNGLPEPIAASLEPFRDRLAASYDALANEFELLRNRKDGMSIRAE